MKTASYNFVERDGMRCCHRCTVRSFPMKSCGAVEYLLARLVPLLRWDQGVTLEYLALISDLPVTFAFSKSSNTAGDQEYVGPSGVLFCYSVWKRCVMRGVCTTSAVRFCFLPKHPTLLQLLVSPIKFPLHDGSISFAKAQNTNMCWHFKFLISPNLIFSLCMVLGPGIYKRRPQYSKTKRLVIHS